MKTETGEVISKKEALVRDAMECGFQRFEAEAFYNCLKRFEHTIEANFMDKLTAHPALARQIVDAHNLASYPAGLKKRELK